MTILTKLEKQWNEKKFVCIGLDSDLAKIPPFLKKEKDPLFVFNKAIIDATHDLVCAYKPNSAFYEQYGAEGFVALQKTISYIKKKNPDIVVILDAKRADIGNTNEAYVKSAFDLLDADAITIHPYLGKEAIQPFLDRKDKGVFVLVRTSNKGAGEFQDLQVNNKEPLYLNVARSVSQSWNEHGNCGIVVGATYPKELAQIRAVVGNIPILIPGVGAQGGSVKETVEAGRNNKGEGMIISSSREILYASSNKDFAQKSRMKTQDLHDTINRYV